MAFFIVKSKVPSESLKQLEDFDLKEFMEILQSKITYTAHPDYEIYILSNKMKRME